MIRLRVIVSLALGLAFACFATLPMTPAWISSDAGIVHAQAKKAKAKPRPKQKQAAPKATAKSKGPPPRIPFTVEEQAAAIVPGIPGARVWGDTAEDFQKVLPTVNGAWLAMSGGGADGAFAAGLLKGWSESGKRPDFAIVTGASIGALLAPYAFLGPRFDGELRNAMTMITSADIFEDRPTHASFLDAWPLRQLIEKRVTPELVAAVAAEHKKGRRLLIVTTNVDAGRRVIWNMGAIAEKGDAAAVKLFRDVLLASSAIPGFFPPVLIDVEANGKKFQEMHIDGSVTAPFFVVPEALLESGSKPARLPATEIYIVLNAKLSPEFALPERTTFSLLSRLLGVVLKTGLRAEIMLIAANAQRLGVPIYVAQVSDSFTHPARGLFDEKYMNALFDYGAERGRNGTGFEPIAQPVPELRSGHP